MLQILIILAVIIIGVPVGLFLLSLAGLVLVAVYAILKVVRGSD